MRKAASRVVQGDKKKNNSWNNKAHERDAMERMGKVLPHVLIRSLRGRPCRRCDAHAKKTPPTRAVQPSISWRSWSSETLLVTHFRSMSCRWVFPPAPRLRSRGWLRVGPRQVHSRARSETPTTRRVASEPHQIKFGPGVAALAVLMSSHMLQTIPHIVRLAPVHRDTDSVSSLLVKTLFTWVPRQPHPRRHRLHLKCTWENLTKDTRHRTVSRCQG